MGKGIFPLAAVVGGVAAVLTGVGLVGSATHGRLRARDRDVIAFADIDCPAPPGMGRAEFLGEVQYLGDAPGKIHLLDEAGPEQLAEAFRKHPWVERVDRVAVYPPDRVRVDVTFRSPVLVIQSETPASQEKDAMARTVDAHGVVLPAAAPREGLPALRMARVPAPEGPAGRPWGAAAAEAGARIAGFLGEHQNRLHLTRWHMDRDRFVLETSAGSRVLWGHAPGEETNDEAPAAIKLERLLDYCARQGDLDRPAGRMEHTVFPRDMGTTRPIEASMAP